MDHATRQSVLGDFSGQTLEHLGSSSRMHQENGTYLVTTANSQGQAETYQVKYTFGVRPLQQYLVEFPGGRLQALPVAWDTRQKRWFYLNAEENVGPDHPLHWTQRHQNWNHMCAECHSTDVHKNYNQSKNTFATTHREMDVGCEACHGPGSLHVQLAQSKSLFWDRNLGTGLVAAPKQGQAQELGVCAPCHSRRGTAFAGYIPGHELLDHYDLQLLQDPLYFVDGQIQDEVYEHGSFLQSKMYRKQVRCSDCHDPHSTRVKFNDNRLCTQCHQATLFDTPAHHHHTSNVASNPASSLDSAETAAGYNPLHAARPGGTLCADCHMPKRTYMQVDERRDHSLRVPRPDFSETYGTPNACTQCHADKPVAWAKEKFVAWYGEKALQRDHFVHALAAGRSAQSLAAVGPLVKLAKHPDQGPVVRATAVALLGNFASAESERALLSALQDKEPLVRVAAVRAFDLRLASILEHDTGDFTAITGKLLPMLEDPIRLVRTEAARVLAEVPLDNYADRHRPAFERVLAEYRQGQQVNADVPESHMNLALLWERLGDLEAAEQEYKLAAERDPTLAAPFTNLSLLYRRQKRYADAQAALEKGVERLGNDTRLFPESSVVWYRYGLALEQLQRTQEAEQALQTACRRDPQNADNFVALALIYDKLNKHQLAMQALQNARALRPGDPGLEQLEAEWKARLP